MPRKKKREELEEENFLDEVDGEIDEVEEEEVEDEEDSELEEDEVEEEEDAEEEEEAAEVESAEEETEEPEEEEIDYPPDDEKAVAALEKLNVRLDVSDKGNVWRVIFDDSNGKDPALVLLKGLPALKELWLLGTKVTADAAEKFKEEHPKVTVYH